MAIATSVIEACFDCLGVAPSSTPPPEKGHEKRSVFIAWFLAVVFDPLCRWLVHLKGVLTDITHASRVTRLKTNIQRSSRYHHQSSLLTIMESKDHIRASI
jgi:hypothetical protein